MTRQFSTNGKEVICNGIHFADTDSHTDAADVARAMAAYEADRDDDPYMPELIETPMPLFAACHAIRREGDEYACSCGKRWDATDGKEHP